MFRLIRALVFIPLIGFSMLPGVNKVLDTGHLINKMNGTHDFTEKGENDHGHTTKT